MGGEGGRADGGGEGGRVNGWKEKEDTWKREMSGGEGGKGGGEGGKGREERGGREGNMYTAEDLLSPQLARDRTRNLKLDFW